MTNYRKDFLARIAMAIWNGQRKIGHKSLSINCLARAMIVADQLPGLFKEDEK